MNFDTEVKQAVYGHFAETGRRPSPEVVAEAVGSSLGDVLDAYTRLSGLKMLVLEPDGSSIRMAPPFSGVATQHVVKAGGKQYFANCAWDALGVLAALHQPHSRCEQSGEHLELTVRRAGPEPSDWLFHCPVPAAQWWNHVQGRVAAAKP